MREAKIEMEDKKLAALGNKKELLPLISLGFKLFDCKNLEEAEDLIKNLSAQGYEMVIIAENIAQTNQKLFLKIIKSFPLAILVLPQPASPAHQGGHKTRSNFAKNMVKKIIKEAVGF